MCRVENDGAKNSSNFFAIVAFCTTYLLFFRRLPQVSATAIKKYMANDPDNMGFTLVALTPNEA